MSICPCVFDFWHMQRSPDNTPVAKYRFCQVQVFLLPWFEHDMLTHGWILDHYTRSHGKQMPVRLYWHMFGLYDSTFIMWNICLCRWMWWVCCANMYISNFIIRHILVTPQLIQLFLFFLNFYVFVTHAIDYLTKPLRVLSFTCQVFACIK